MYLSILGESNFEPEIFFGKFNISSSFYVLPGITFHGAVPVHPSSEVFECATCPPF